MKNVAKTESMSEFLARGGKVTICPTFDASKKYYKKQPKAEAKLADVLLNEDLSALPLSLKIAYGIK